MQTKRRSVALLLILAMLTVAVVSLLPLTASAEPVGDHASDIQDFGWQALSDANQTDDHTDLRVMFTIGNLDYEEVGFVFSTSNSAPTAGGSGTYATTNVHATINAGGDDMPAGEGRFWVAVKLSNIPNASFETPIYIRPFVYDGENYSYLDATSITVCQALTYDKTVAGESLLWNSKAPTEGPVAYRYKAATDTYSISQNIGKIRGKNTAHEQHFFTTEDDPTWKALYFEYSFLWNPTLANSTNARMSAVSFKDCELFGFYTRDDDDWHEFGGHFDMNKTYVYGSKGMDGPEWTSYENPAYSSNCIRYGTYKGSMDSTITADSYPAIGQYGWHRIGFVYDMSTQSNSTKQGKDKHKVLYWATSSLYIDGVKVWEVRNSIQGWWNGSDWSGKSYALRPNSAMPWIAIKDGVALTSQFTDNGGGILYNGIHYIELDSVTVNMNLTNIAASENAVYIAVSDVHWSCGGEDFRRKVSPVADPVDRTIVLDDKGTADPADDVTCSGKIWYVFDN